MVVVQLAMGQFTPRVLRTILRDRPSQLAIRGLRCHVRSRRCLSMREVRGPGSGEEGYVPGLAIVVSFVLIIVSIVVFGLVRASHWAVAARVVLDRARRTARPEGLLDEVYPPPGHGPARARSRAPAGRNDQASSAAIDHDCAGRAGVRGAIARSSWSPRSGSSCPPVLRSSGCDGTQCRPGSTGGATQSIALGLERTLDQDVAYGFRMLVDIAERSLAESAVPRSDHRRAGHRPPARLPTPAGVSGPFPTARYRDDAGEVRLHHPRDDGLGRLRAPCLRGDPHSSEPPSPQVSRRLQAALEDLRECRADRAPCRARRAAVAPDCERPLLHRSTDGSGPRPRP